MELYLSEKQIGKLVKSIKEDESGTPEDAKPKSGTSSSQSGGNGYPDVSKWESGATRGAGNQIGVTKWSDVVGSKLIRGKANQLREQSTQITNRSNFKGVNQPESPIPAVQAYPRYQVFDKNGGIINPYDRKNRFGEYIDWYYKSPIEKSGTVATKDVLESKYRNDLNNWLISNMNMTLQDWERYYGRISKSGLNVPKGFNPDLYDEFLSKEKQLRTKALNLLAKSVKTGNQNDKIQYDNVVKQIETLKREYSNPNFSYGITKDELTQYNLRRKDINDYYNSLIKKSNENKIFDYEPIRSDNTYVKKQGNVYSNIDILRSEWTNELKKLDMLFGRDDWTKGVSVLGQDFDRVWDKWGLAIQVVGNFAIIAASGGIAGIVESGIGALGFVITSGGIRAAAPYVADATFNTLIGAYEASRGKNEESLISFLCAMVPYISYSGDIGRVSVKTAENLAKKVAASKLNDVKSMDMFIKSLTPSERYIFRNTMSLPKNMIKNNFDLAVKEISEKIGKSNLKIPKSGPSTVVPLFMKQLAIEGGIPLAGAISNALTRAIQDSNTKFSSDDLLKIKSYLKNEMSRLSTEKAIYISDKLIEKMGAFFGADDFINFAKTLHYKEPSKEDIDYLNKKYNLKIKVKNKQ